MTLRQGFSWSSTLAGTSSREGDKGGGSWHHILITNNQILRKRGSECQLLHSVGWLSQGIGWYGFHNDDPACYRIFRYFLNILSLGSFFQGTKMRNSRGFSFLNPMNDLSKGTIIFCFCQYSLVTREQSSKKNQTDLTSAWFFLFHFQQIWFRLICGLGWKSYRKMRGRNKLMNGLTTMVTVASSLHSALIWLICTESTR